MIETHKELKDGEIIHHINWDYNDYDESNLIIIPKQINELIHGYLGYVNREEINILVENFISKKLKHKPISVLNLRLSNLINTNKKCEISLKCKNNIGILDKQKEVKIKKISHKKIYEKVYGKVKDGWDVHHIDWDHENNNINNLIAIPKKIHYLTHKYWGYVEREEYEILLVEFPKYPHTASLGYLNHQLIKFVNTNKRSNLAIGCKGIMDSTILRFRAAFDWRDGKNGLS